MKYLLVLFLFSISLVLHGQEYDRPPLSNLAIEKSLNDVDFFRMTMLDNNFEHDSEETKGEVWGVRIKPNDIGYINPYSDNAILAAKIAGKRNYQQDMKILFQRFNLGIYIIITKKLEPRYAKAFEELINLSSI